MLDGRWYVDGHCHPARFHLFFGAVCRGARLSTDHASCDLRYSRHNRLRDLPWPGGKSMPPAVLIHLLFARLLQSARESLHLQRIWPDSYALSRVKLDGTGHVCTVPLVSGAVRSPATYELCSACLCRCTCRSCSVTPEAIHPLLQFPSFPVRCIP